MAPSLPPPLKPYLSSPPGEAKPTGKSHEFVLLPFMLLSNFEIRGCFFFNFEIDSISETLTNAKTRHDFFLALGFFVVHVEYRSVITHHLQHDASSILKKPPASRMHYFGSCIILPISGLCLEQCFTVPNMMCCMFEIVIRSYP